MPTYPTDVIVAAQASQGKWQIPASLTLAQWAIESAYGTRMPPGSNNPFGIKALPGQPSVAVPTREVIDGASVTITAAFRAFPTIADAFDTHGRLLGLAKPYRAMVTRFLQSPRQPADVNDLANALTGVYATAPNYGSALIATMQKSNLYQYDKEPDMPTPTPVPATPTAPTAPTAPIVPAGHAPTVSQSVQIDWGSLAAQLLAHEAPIIEALARTGINAALAAIPMGSLISTFIGPKVIDQYIEQGLTALEGVINTQVITIDDSNTLAATVANLFVKNEAFLAAFLQNNIEPMIDAALTKLGLKPATA